MIVPLVKIAADKWGDKLSKFSIKCYPNCTRTAPLYEARKAIRSPVRKGKETDTYMTQIMSSESTPLESIFTGHALV